MSGQTITRAKAAETCLCVGGFIAAYAGLSEGTNKINMDDGNDITRSDYTNGYALYAYNPTSDLAEDDHVFLMRQGIVRLNLKFGTAMAQTVTVIT